MKKIRNMKRIYFGFIALVFAVTACDNSFLEEENLFKKNTENFYKTPTDIEEAIAGMYIALYSSTWQSDEALFANLLSDMMLGGGGPDDVLAKNIDRFVDPVDDTFKDLWVRTYQGITRANTLIEKVADIDFKAFYDTQEEADAFKNAALGEAYFMRAHFYFRAAKMFGGMPLRLKINDPLDVARSTFTETFQVIASDLKQAIELMPSINITSIPSEDYGHANKWTAQAFMARVYLYYTGYMTNIENASTSDLPLMDGGSISKVQVVAYLDDCIANSGHKLAEDFRNLWPYSYVNQSAGSVILPWADTEGLQWVGQDGPTTAFGTGNLETMFSIRYAFADYSGNDAKTNRMPLFFGVRGNSLEPFGQGWGWGSINPKLWNEWDDADPRKVGSILELGSAEQGTGGYSGAQGDHETGLFNKKYSSLQHGGGNGVRSMYDYMYNVTSPDFQTGHAQDFITMRFADVLLMHSEISETATGLNQVRDRAGLAAVGYSIDAIKEERLHELAFEGLRWFDIVRWGDVNTAFDESVNVSNEGVDGTYNVTYRPETKGLVSIPESEIRLSGGVYEQNPGW